MLAYVKPYREARGEWVSMERYDGGLDQIREQVETENVVWDVVDFELSDLIRGCREGLLEKLDHGSWADGEDEGAGPVRKKRVRARPARKPATARAAAAADDEDDEDAPLSMRVKPSAIPLR